ncbi:MAG: AIR synthase-related protein, partial [Bacteroidota bacterium]|nr:AIR synthase-related protein [Bacteroidota bacterium]
FQRSVLCDPQTSGGLLIAVSESHSNKIASLLKENGLGDFATPIGRMIPRNGAKLVHVLD